MFNFNIKSTKVDKCLADHQQDVVRCFEKFEEFFEVLFSDETDENSLQSLRVAIDNYEDAADHELRCVVDILSQSYLPSTRVELIGFINSTDEVANHCQEIARQVLIERVKVPGEVRSDLLEIIAITKCQLDILYKAFDMLINDYKTIFKNRKILDDIRAEESKVDSIEQMLYARIFDIDMPLYEKVYYRTLVSDICQVSDIIEDISDHIQVMLIERES